MFQVKDDGIIHITRGDYGVLDVSALNGEGNNYIFESGDMVRFKVYERNRPDRVVLQKDISISDKTYMVTFELDGADTKIGELISKPKDYWYEVELNPDTCPITFIGYDIDGPKIFRLYPEGADQ